MNDPDGRYANCALRYRAGPDGKPIVYLERRFLPEPGSLKIIGTAAMEPGERLDNFSARILGPPTAWWRIADATRAIHPEELEDPPLQRHAIPLPEAGQ